MPWSAGPNAGFSRAPHERLTLPLVLEPPFDPARVSVASQEAEPGSLLNWVRATLALRRRWAPLRRGELLLVDAQPSSILAFMREHAAEEVLVVANLSARSVSARLDLRAYAGRELVELRGGSHLPPIAPDGAYDLLLPPHGCLWVELRAPGGR